MEGAVWLDLRGENGAIGARGAHGVALFGASFCTYMSIIFASLLLRGSEEGSET